MRAKNKPTNKTSANKTERAMQLYRNLPASEREQILRLVRKRLGQK